MRPRRLLPAALVALLVPGLAACGGSSAGDPDAPAGTPDAGGEPPAFRVDRAGTVSMTEGGSGGVYAALYDRAFEQPLPLVVATAGDCAVYHRDAPTCAGGCGADICVADGQCAPYAMAASAGEIAITGLRQPVTLTPSAYGYTSPSLPADFFADDAAIHVSATGDAIPAFTADVGGVAPLVDQLGGGVELRDGEDETIRWTPAAGDAQIQLALALGWHGQPWTDLLLCETADDGELVVPAALVTEMPYFEVGLFQWPSWIMRFHRAWVTTAGGPIEIIAASQVGLGLSHPMP